VSLNFCILTFNKGCPILHPKRWTSLFIALAASLLGVVALFNYTINPYNTFDLKPHAFNHYKKRVLSDRMTKFYEAKHIAPKTLMMGTSRIGLFNSDLLKRYAPSPIYNLALAGSSIQEQYDYLRYMIEHLKLETLVWSLDLFAFNPDKRLNPSFERSRLQTHPYWRDIQLSLLSAKTVEKSFGTLKDSLKDKTATDDYALYEKSEYRTMQGGYKDANVIEQKIAMTLNLYANSHEFLRSKRFKNPDALQQGLSYVRKIVALCHRKNITLHLYLSPPYVKHQELYNTLGLTKSYAAWKSGLAALSSYTDFSTHNTITKNKMNFRDSSHVTSAIAPLIFGKIFHDDLLNIPEGFGLYVQKKSDRAVPIHIK